MTETPKFRVGDMIENRYRVLSVINKGGMGILYRVSDEAYRNREAHQNGAGDGEVVALKTVKLDVPAAETPKRIEYFQREFQLLTQLYHPNLISVHDYGITVEGELYFTMEWGKGQDLEIGMRSLEPGATIPVIVQICRALAYLHARGVIHGDLKPANVLVSDDQVKLADFGVALEARSTERQAKYYILRANLDPRAKILLDTAHGLQEQAAKITDGEIRRSFLENVTAHREIVREWTNQQTEE